MSIMNAPTPLRSPLRNIHHRIIQNLEPLNNYLVSFKFNKINKKTRNIKQTLILEADMSFRFPFIYKIR